MDAKILFNTYAPLIYGTILKFTDDTEKAERILEESFINIYGKLQDYPAAECRLFTWMIKIALAECKETLSVSEEMIKLKMMPFLKFPSAGKFSRE